MANKREWVCFKESIKLSSKEKQEDICCIGERKVEDKVSSELNKYCEYGADMWLALGKDFYI